MNPNHAQHAWSRFTLRTLILVMMGASVLCVVLFVHPLHQVEAHFLIVLAFLVPGASFGWDVRRESRAVAIGGCVAAVLGSIVLSVAVLLLEFLG